MKKIIIPLFFFFLIFGISNVYSQEFDNSLSVVISENEPIIIGSQGEYGVDPNAYSRIITFDEPFTGTYNIKIPKSIPSWVQLYSEKEHPSQEIFLENHSVHFDLHLQ